MGYKNYRLTVIKGYNKGDEFPLEAEEITIGRGEDNGIVLNTVEVSRTHAVLTKTEGGYMIRDLGSTNGTFVDKKSVGGKYLLKPGDTVMLGDAIYLTYGADADPEETLVSPRPDDLNASEVTAVTAKPANTAPEPPPTKPPAPEPKKEMAIEEKLVDAPTPKEKKDNTWLWAGIGCLVVIFFLIVVGVIIFDYLDLWCTPPFDTFLGSIFNYSCQ
jgi:predicted component of type VI protein secretion system